MRGVEFGLTQGQINALELFDEEACVPWGAIRSDVRVGLEGYGLVEETRQLGAPVLRLTKEGRRLASELMRRRDKRAAS